jgi:siroheme synthase-like protein
MAQRLPLALDLRDKPVVVVGGGAVAERKARALLAAGAEVRLIAPRLTAYLEAQAAAHLLQWQERAYKRGDVAGAWLAFAAADSPAVNAEVAAEAEAAGVFCNVAAPPEAGSCHVMAALPLEGVTVAIATDGVSPYAARRLRERLEAALPPELARLAVLLGELRPAVQVIYGTEDGRRAIYERMWDSDAAERLAAGDEAGARAILRAILEGGD